MKLVANPTETYGGRNSVSAATRSSEAFLTTDGGLTRRASPPEAMLGAVAGALVLGIGVLRARVYPRWTGIVMIVSAVAGPVAGGGPAVLQNAAAILGSIALAGIGCRLFATVSASTIASSPTPAAARYSAAGAPRPPAPTISTLAAFSACWPGPPISRSTRWRA